MVNSCQVIVALFYLFIFFFLCLYILWSVNRNPNPQVHFLPGQVYKFYLGVTTDLKTATWKDVHFIYTRFCVICTNSQSCSYLFGFIHPNLWRPHTGLSVLSWAPYANTNLNFQSMLDIETIKSQWRILQLPLSVAGVYVWYFYLSSLLGWLLCH